MYKGDYKLGSTIRHIFTCADSLQLSDVRIICKYHKTKQDGVSLEEKFLGEEGMYRLTIDTSRHTDFFVRGDFTIIVKEPLFEFSLENRYTRGTDGANTVIPDVSGARDVQWANLASTLEGIIVLLNSRAPAHEYDTQLDTTLSSRSPAAEYDKQLDKKMSSLSPTGEYLPILMEMDKTFSHKGEYHGVLASNFKAIFDSFADVVNDIHKIIEKLPEGSMASSSVTSNTHAVMCLIKEDLKAYCEALANKLDAMSGAGGVTLASEQPNYAPMTAGTHVEVSQDVLNAIESIMKDIRVFDPSGTPDVSCAWIEALSYIFADWRNPKEDYGSRIVLHKNTGEKLLERDINNDGVKKTSTKWRT